MPNRNQSSGPHINEVDLASLLIVLGLQRHVTKFGLIHDHLV